MEGAVTQVLLSSCSKQAAQFRPWCQFCWAHLEGAVPGRMLSKLGLGICFHSTSLCELAGDSPCPSSTVGRGAQHVEDYKTALRHMPEQSTADPRPGRQTWSKRTTKAELRTSVGNIVNLTNQQANKQTNLFCSRPTTGIKKIQTESRGEQRRRGAPAL